MEEALIVEIRKRLNECPIPLDAVTDYWGTDHYEIGDPRAKPPESYWWLDYIDEAVKAGSHTEEGKRLGAVLDYACAYRRDIGALLAEIDRLHQALEELGL
jgi:hypothetical protein